MVMVMLTMMLPFRPFYDDLSELMVSCWWWWSGRETRSAQGTSFEPRRSLGYRVIGKKVIDCCSPKSSAVIASIGLSIL